MVALVKHMGKGMEKNNYTRFIMVALVKYMGKGRGEGNSRFIMVALVKHMAAFTDCYRRH